MTLSIITTVLVFVIIPVGVLLVVGSLVLSGSDRTRRSSRRYRPGRPYDFQPVWFLAAPEQVGIVAAGRPPARRSRGRCWRTAPAPGFAPALQEAQVTVGDVEQQEHGAQQQSSRPHQPTGPDQPLTGLDKPGGDTQEANPERAAGSDAHGDSPFTTRQLLRLDEALRIADRQTGLTFSVYVGQLGTPSREAAEKLHKQIENSSRAVLVAVSPNERRLEIVTGNEARKRISDRDAKLAALSMAAAFAGGDLGGGVLSGIDQLASHAGRH